MNSDPVCYFGGHLVHFGLVPSRYNNGPYIGPFSCEYLSLIPRTGNIRPVNVISPVMATSRLAGRLVSSEKSAMAMVIPADGPSFCMAPEGT